MKQRFEVNQQVYWLCPNFLKVDEAILEHIDRRMKNPFCRVYIVGHPKMLYHVEIEDLFSSPDDPGIRERISFYLKQDITKVNREIRRLKVKKTKLERKLHNANSTV